MDAKRRFLLLVEDEVLLATTEKIQLEKYGYQVFHVTNGESAVSFVERGKDPVDIILMDINLGMGMDGTEAAKTILAKQDIPILFLSSYTEPEIVQKTEEISSYGYVVKSSSITVLDASIKMAFKLFDAKQQRKLVELALRKSEALLDVTGSLARVGGWQLDVETNLVTWTKETYHIHELPVGEDPPLETAINFYHPDDQGTLIKALQEALDFGKPYDLDLRLVTAKNNKIWVRTTCQPEIVQGKIQRLFGSFQDITEQKRTEQVIQRQLEEKDLLLREINHRVKNNISQISSLLSLQIEQSENREVKVALQEAVSRVSSMDVLYEKLLLSKSVTSISFKSYVTTLVSSLLEVYRMSKAINVTVDIHDFVIDTKRAVSLGIIINELLTNVFKYAFPKKSSGNVHLTTESLDGLVTITIQDDGQGFLLRKESNPSPGFGLTIVQLLVEQLEGTFDISSNHGVKSLIRFRLE